MRLKFPVRPNTIQERKWEMLVEMVENDKDGKTDALAD